MRISDWSSDVCSSDLSYAIPRLLMRHGLRFDDICLWEIHEAFAAQVLANVAAIERDDWIRSKTGVDADFGTLAWDRVNPNGGSVAIGHPFGATGARDLSQTVKELWSRPVGSRSEEHTSELQSLMRISYAVFCLNKKNKY